MSGYQHTPAAISPRERHGTHCTGGWVGPRAGSGQTENLAPHRNSVASSPVVSRYTDRPTRPTFKHYTLIMLCTIIPESIEKRFKTIKYIPGS